MLSLVTTASPREFYARDRNKIINAACGLLGKEYARPVDAIHDLLALQGYSLGRRHLTGKTRSTVSKSSRTVSTEDALGEVDARLFASFVSKTGDYFSGQHEKFSAATGLGPERMAEWRSRVPNLGDLDTVCEHLGVSRSRVLKLGAHLAELHKLWKDDDGVNPYDGIQALLDEGEINRRIGGTTSKDDANSDLIEAIRWADANAERRHKEILALLHPAKNVEMSSLATTLSTDAFGSPLHEEAEEARPGKARRAR